MILKFKQTCWSCPEQYDVYKVGIKNLELVGYVKLRFGELTVKVPDSTGEIIYNIKFPNGLKGNFSSYDERKKYLRIIKNVIKSYYRNNKLKRQKKGIK